jgi:hypothetical protein
MEVHIEDIVSTVRSVDGEALVSPKVMQTIVRAVLEAVREREEHRARIGAEQKISRGVRHEMEEGQG